MVESMTEEERLAFEVEMELEAARAGSSQSLDKPQAAGSKRRGPPIRKQASIVLPE
jgi:hypothetical protein